MRDYVARTGEFWSYTIAGGHSRLEVLSVLSVLASAEDRDAAAAEPNAAEVETLDRLDELLAAMKGDTGTRIFGETSNHRPREPLREWDAATFSGDLDLVIQGSASGDAPMRLINADRLSSEDLIAFGRLNMLCVLKWFEPLVCAVWPAGPQLDPEHANLLGENTKLFR